MNPSEKNKIIGQNIKYVRSKMNLTQAELAQYIGVSREQLAYYESGERSITTIQLTKLAELFCMDEYDFYEEDIQNVQVNIAFAFRAEKLSLQDLKSISQFKKIVRNYINMEKVLNSHE